MITDTSNRNDAERFLATLAGGQSVTFQTFDESQAKRPALSKVLHGTFDKHADALEKLNDQGAGVFVMVCQGDAKGRKKENVTKVRAVFIDLDGAPLAPVGDAPIKPHITVESSPGRYHAYWLVEDCTLDMFSPLQKALAKRFDGDICVHDLPRVMRVPGFMHRKDEPSMTKIINIADHAPYTIGELIGELQLNIIPHGGRNNHLAQTAGALRAREMGREQIGVLLHEANMSQCAPPLPASEVESIADSISRYPPNKSSSNSRQVFDHPAFLLNANDMLAKEEIIFMNLNEFGLYMKLLCSCWVNGNTFKDHSKLAKILRLSEPEIRKALTPQVLAHFVEEEDGRLHSPFLRDQRNREMEKRGMHAACGRKGGMKTQEKHRKSSHALASL